jgi:hypothetical protein
MATSPPNRRIKSSTTTAAAAAAATTTSTATTQRHHHHYHYHDFMTAYLHFCRNYGVKHAVSDEQSMRTRLQHCTMRDTRWDFARVPLGSHGTRRRVHALLALVSMNEELTDLSFAACGLRPMDVLAVLDAVRFHPKLARLDLRGNTHNAQTQRAVQQALKTHVALRAVHVGVLATQVPTSSSIMMMGNAAQSSSAAAAAGAALPASSLIPQLRELLSRDAVTDHDVLHLIGSKTTSAAPALSSLSPNGLFSVASSQQQHRRKQRQQQQHMLSVQAMRPIAKTRQHLLSQLEQTNAEVEQLELRAAATRHEQEQQQTQQRMPKQQKQQKQHKSAGSFKLRRTSWNYNHEEEQMLTDMLLLDQNSGNASAAAAAAAATTNAMRANVAAAAAALEKKQKQKQKQKKATVTDDNDDDGKDAKDDNNVADVDENDVVVDALKQAAAMSDDDDNDDRDEQEEWSSGSTASKNSKNQDDDDDATDAAAADAFRQLMDDSSDVSSLAAVTRAAKLKSAQAENLARRAERRRARNAELKQQKETADQLQQQQEQEQEQEQEPEVAAPAAPLPVTAAVAAAAAAKKKIQQNKKQLLVRRSLGGIVRLESISEAKQQEQQQNAVAAAMLIHVHKPVEEDEQKEEVKAAAAAVAAAENKKNNMMPQLSRESSLNDSDGSPMHTDDEDDDDDDDDDEEEDEQEDGEFRAWLVKKRAAQLAVHGLLTRVLNQDGTEVARLLQQCRKSKWRDAYFADRALCTVMASQLSKVAEFAKGFELATRALKCDPYPVYDLQHDPLAEWTALMRKRVRNHKHKHKVRRRAMYNCRHRLQHETQAQQRARDATVVKIMWIRAYTLTMMRNFTEAPQFVDELLARGKEQQQPQTSSGAAGAGADEKKTKTYPLDKLTRAKLYGLKGILAKFTYEVTKNNTQVAKAGTGAVDARTVLANERSAAASARLSSDWLRKGYRLLSREQMHLSHRSRGLLMGVSSATMLTLAGEARQARKLARNILSVALAILKSLKIPGNNSRYKEVNGTLMQLHAAVAEANMLLRRPREAYRWYEMAVELGKQIRFGVRCATIMQYNLSLLAHHGVNVGRTLSLFITRSVVVFCGHQVDHPNHKVNSAQR